jgi:hypothetical protein
MDERAKQCQEECGFHVCPPGWSQPVWSPVIRAQGPSVPRAMALPSDNLHMRSAQKSGSQRVGPSSGHTERRTLLTVIFQGRPVAERHQRNSLWESNGLRLQGYVFLDTAAMFPRSELLAACQVGWADSILVQLAPASWHRRRLPGVRSASSAPSQRQMGLTGEKGNGYSSNVI